MARIRTLKPEFWGDEKTSPLEPIHRLVFLGLISQADDAGRLVDSVKLLDGLIFPETDDSCRASLVLLAELGRILRYTSASGQRLVQIVNWEKHQKVKNPSEYTLPAPPTESLPRPSVESTETQTPRSPIPDPPSPNSDPRSPTVAREKRQQAGIDALVGYVGEKSRVAIETIAEFPQIGPGWATGLLATWANGSLESDRFPEVERPVVLGIALRRFSTDASRWYGPLFASFVDRAYTDLLEHRAAKVKAEEAQAAGSTTDRMKELEAEAIARLNESTKTEATGPPTDITSLTKALAQKLGRNPQDPEKPNGRIQRMKDYEMADLYREGLSTNEIAARSGHSPSTVSVRLNRLGIEMRPGGRPRAPTPETPNGHRGPRLEGVEPMEPRYSCGHKRTGSSTQCRICDRCPCAPKKRRPVRKYSGCWLDGTCGKLIEPGT